MAEQKVKIDIKRSPDFRPVFSTGVFGGLNPSEGHMIFYVDRLVPGMVEGVVNEMKTDSVERELQVEVHMSAPAFVSLARWMENHIRRLEKEGVLIKKEEK